MKGRGEGGEGAVVWLQSVIMQAVIIEGGREEEERGEGRVLTRKQGRKSSNMFKKKKEDDQLPRRDKRCHSTQHLRFLKHPISDEPDASPPPLSRDDSTPDQSRSKMVFNKFSRAEKEEAREWMLGIQQAFEEMGSAEWEGTAVRVGEYLVKLEENNAKLLEVNYFFQKELSDIMAQKQLTKRLDKCSKNNCLQCRYHLEKENRWKIEKLELSRQLQQLSEQVSARTSHNYDPTTATSLPNSQATSLLKTESQPTDQEDSQFLRLRSQVRQKEEDYLILLNEYNYLDAQHRQTKARMGKLMEDYRYLSIENRTLLNVKTKLMEKEVQCIKYKDERDHFKRKLIDNHKKQMAGKETKGKSFQQEESLFSLSSASDRLQGLALSQADP